MSELPMTKQGVDMNGRPIIMLYLKNPWLTEAEAGRLARFLEADLMDIALQRGKKKVKHNRV